MILKALPYVEDGVSKQILVQQKNVTLLPEIIPKAQLLDKVKPFLVNVICSNIQQAELAKTNRSRKDIEQQLTAEFAESVETEALGDEMFEWIEDRLNQEMNIWSIRGQVSDYVNMCFRTKTKVRLDVYSVRQAINLHDDLADNRSYRYENTAKVSVPKKSKFNKLRKILPEEFEWIKSRKRLIIETEMQHHCVWSYATKITNDNCAIYSYVDKNAEYSDDGSAKRYTIEFSIDANGKYHIVQVQGKYDRVNTTTMKAFIQDILDQGQ
jgi:hypothetical protein